jgi:hypothetical protein
VTFHDPGASREAETRAGKLVSVMQPPEDREDLIRVFGSDPDTVVLNGEDKFSTVTDGRNVERRAAAQKGSPA